MTYSHRIRRRRRPRQERSRFTVEAVAHYSRFTSAFGNDAVTATVLAGPMQVEDMRLAIVMDPQGATFGVLQT